MSYSKFQHLEEKVEAICLTNDTQEEVAATLGKEATNNQLAKLHQSFNGETQCMEFVYRYKSDSVDMTLARGDYLVRLNSGQYVARTAEQFLADYIDITNDPSVEKPQTPAQSLIAFISAFYPDAGITSEDDLKQEGVGEALIEGMSSWYDAEADVFDIKFTDCGITSPRGLAALMQCFPKASFMTDTTKFTLNFNNGAYHEGDPNTTPNVFNTIGLQELVGEIQDLPAALRRRLIGVTFKAVGQGAESAVAPSVTGAQWDAFVVDMMRVSGISKASDVKR